MKTLYTRDASGATRFWRMELNPDDPAQYRTVSGVLGGAEVPSAWTQAVAKNVGRSNATTPEEQAQAEVDASYRQKLDRKYHEDPDNVGAHKFFAPMLAHRYSQGMFPLAGGCWTQPKLDGFRCVASAGGMTSRQGKPFYIPHVWEQLEPIFARDPDLVLDGELYHHELREDFNTLGSLVKTQKRTPEQALRVVTHVQYHVYDVPSVQGGFGDRLEHLHLLFGGPGGLGPIKVVETILAADEERLDVHFARYLRDGYEGAMVRFDLPYEVGKRSKSLLKLKDFQDGEFELVRVEEGVGNWAGYAKTATIRLKDGREQSSGMRGSREFLAQVLRDWKRYSQVTVRYQNVTPDGFLRFPIIVDWHEGERSY